MLAICHFTFLTLDLSLVHSEPAVKLILRKTHDIWIEILTIAVVKLGRPPDHAVGLPVPDAHHHLLHQLLLPGGGLAWTGVPYGVTKLPFLVLPGDLHPHIRCWNSQPTASC